MNGSILEGEVHMAKPSEHRFSGSLAEEYELITLAYPEFEAFQRRMIQRIDSYLHTRDSGESAPVRILEIGTGNGFTTRLIIETIARHRGECKFVSIDNDPEMLRQATEHVPHDRCDLVEADALAFLQDQPDEEWDVVASAFTIHNLEVEYRVEVEREIHRTLKTGGLFTNADKYAPDGQERFEALTFQVERFFDAFLASGRTELLRKWVLHNIDDQSPRYVMLGSEAIPRLEALGFRDVELEGRAHMQAVLHATRR
jgi:tRNA (cmo5U34)-methyltransferase